MFKRNRKNFSQRGSLLATTLMLSAAIAVAMIGVLSFSQFSTKQAATLVARNELRQLAQEKITRDILALVKNADLGQFDTLPLRADWGEAQSSIRAVNVDSGTAVSSYYLVVIATMTSRDASPNHLRLETLISQESILPTEPVEPVTPQEDSVDIKDVEDGLDQALRQLFPGNDVNIEPLKEQALAILKEKFGDKMERLPATLERVDYRGAPPADGPAAAANSEPTKDTWMMSPINFSATANRPKIRLWKETYF